MAHEQEKMEKQAALGRVRLEHELAENGMRKEAEHRQLAREIELDAARRRIENDLSEPAIRARLVEALPAIAEKLPKPNELKSFTLSGDGLGALVSGLLTLVQSVQDGKRN
jgi:hypothetical protein